ncbi:MAG: LptF/LptG family permease [Thermoguttaceae bacterium]|jgi:hypothetical protein
MGFKIFDKYLFKKTVGTFCGLLFVTLFVFAIIDLAANGWISLRNTAEIGRFFTYYLLFYNKVIGSFYPIFIFLAAGVALYVIDSNQELVALKTMGASPARIAAPLVAAAIAISLGLTAFREFYVPTQVNYLSLSRTDYIRYSDEMEVNRASDDAGNFSFDGEKIYFSEGKLIKPRIILGNTSNRYGNRFTAEAAVYCPAEGNRPQGWLFEGVTTPTEFLTSPSIKDPITERTIFFSPVDHPDWLAGNQLFVATNITPTNLVAGDNWTVYGKLNELNRAIKDPTFKRKSVELVVSVHTRIGQLFINLIPFFFGVPIYLTRPMGTKPILKVATASLGAIPCLLSLVFQVVGLTMGIPDIAVCGPWIFVPFALALYSSLFSKEI